jgi:hypothetical protein
VTASDRAISDHVVVQCPACGACESVEAQALADRPAMVCRECGETWPAGGMQPDWLPRPPKKQEALGPLLVAERKPLVTYTDAADSAWKAKIEGDYWPEEAPRNRRLPLTAAAVAAVLFLAAFFGARQAAVAALPDLASLYAAIGLPVNLDRLAIENVGAERVNAAGSSHVTVRATLKNLAASERTLPVLVAEIDGGGGQLGTFGFDPPVKTIAAGQSIPVEVELGAVPETAQTVELRLKRRGETLAVAGRAQLAPE